MTQRISEEYKKLLAYIKGKPHGLMMDYSTVQSDTGVVMDIEGRNKLRQAIIRAKRAYLCTPDVGYQLASADNTIAIERRDLKGTVSAVKKMARDVAIVSEFRMELTETDRQLHDVMGNYLSHELTTHQRITSRIEIKKLNMPSVPDIKIE